MINNPGIIKKIKTIGGVAAVLLGVYLIVFAAFYMIQDSIIFQGKKLPLDYAFRFDQPFDEFMIESDGEQINALLFRSPAPSKGLILYFHGNADNLQRWGNYAVDFTSLGYDILMADYRGYGKSTGKPDEAALYKDALDIKLWADKNIPSKKLIVYGRSLGSAVASYLATTTAPELLVLETPFDEIKGAMSGPLKPMLTIFPLHYSFPNNKFLPDVKCRRIIVHGTDDWVVPLSSAMKLKPLLAPGDKFLIIEGGGHKDLREFKEYQELLKEVF